MAKNSATSKNPETKAPKSDKIVVKNLMTGKEVEIDADTPWCLRVDSESYWCS